ncbi:unnamed protein product [Polarella glacialis]|uniref:Uncharacterized protein n=1 Tax=Polarella glacialis TaxID=89957 RepID=A0A813GC83_POLGL|nr:unnamed protein product [Polarella glacialis]
MKAAVRARVLAAALPVRGSKSGASRPLVTSRSSRPSPNSLPSLVQPVYSGRNRLKRPSPACLPRSRSGSCPAKKSARLGNKRINKIPEKEETVAITVAEIEKGSSVCEGLAVGRPTQRAYQGFFEEFRVWRRATLPNPLAKEVRQEEILGFIDHFFLENRSFPDIEKGVAAIFASLPRLRRLDMPRVKRALKGYKKKRPPVSRYPLPEEVVAGVAAVLHLNHHPRNARSVLCQFYGYLRPGECRKLKVKDLVIPAGGMSKSMNNYAVIIAPFEDLQPSKTQTFDDTVIFDYPVWLGKEFQKLATGRNPQELLFDIKVAESIELFREALRVLGLDGELYQLRHGGASTDWLEKRRTPGEIKARGRWQCDSSLRRYAKAGQVQKTLNKMKSLERGFCSTAFSNLEKILNNKMNLAMPRPGMKQGRGNS